MVHCNTFSTKRIKRKFNDQSNYTKRRKYTSTSNYNSPLENRWIQVHFSNLNILGCQTKWQYNCLPNNKKYRANSQRCGETDHHSHWYCKNYYTNLNPCRQYIPDPTENTICQCNKPDESEYDSTSDDGSTSPYNQENIPITSDLNNSTNDIYGGWVNMQNLHDEQEEPQKEDIDSPIPRVFDSWPEVNEDDYNPWKSETTVPPSLNQPIIITDLKVNSTEEIKTDTETLDEILNQE